MTIQEENEKLDYITIICNYLTHSDRVGVSMILQNSWYVMEFRSYYEKE